MVKYLLAMNVDPLIKAILMCTLICDLNEAFDANDDTSADVPVQLDMPITQLLNRPVDDSASDTEGALADTRPCAVAGNCFDRQPPQPPTAAHLPHTSRLVCCHDALPHAQFSANALNASVDLSSLVVNFTRKSHGHAFDDNCLRWSVSYLLNTVDYTSSQYSIEIRCDCNTSASRSAESLDERCKPDLGTCLNGGRSVNSAQNSCECVDNYFGRRCQYRCVNGKLEPDDKYVDYCRCSQLFTGIECNIGKCENGGRAIASAAGAVNAVGACFCPRQYYGPLCQWSLGSGGGVGSGGDALVGSNDRTNDERLSASLRRDFTGTIISLVLVVTLLSTMYCLLRRRLRAANRRAHLINDMISQQFSTQNSHQMNIAFLNGVQHLTHEQQVALAALAAQHNRFHPPPYGAAPNELPPLPTYEDIIKEQKHLHELSVQQYYAADSVDSVPLQSSSSLELTAIQSSEPAPADRETSNVAPPSYRQERAAHVDDSTLNHPADAQRDTPRSIHT